MVRDLRSTGTFAVLRALLLVLAFVTAWAGAPREVRAQVVLTPPPARVPSPVTPKVGPAPDLRLLVGHPISRIDVQVDDATWPLTEVPHVTSVRAGETFTSEAARRALGDVLTQGLFARARVEATPEPVAAGSKSPLGVHVVVRVVQRRLVEALRLDVHGAPIDRDELLREADLRDGGEVLGIDFPEYQTHLKQYLTRRGFPGAEVTLTSRETDDPTRILLLVDVVVGGPRTLDRRVYYVFGEDEARLAPLLDDPHQRPGVRHDESAFATADAAIEARLHARGYVHASVSHDVVLAAGLVTLRLRVDSGALFVPQFEGNQSYDADALTGALALDLENDLAPGHLAQKVRDFYVARGFLDVEVTLETRGGVNDRVHPLVFHIIEHARVKVVSRAYPCLSIREIRHLTEGGPTSAGDVGTEIDSFLDEALPGADLVEDPDPAGLDRLIGGASGANPPSPIDLDPYSTYDAATYEQAVVHVQELYRNEGFLHAQVGPVQVVRRRCNPRSPAGRCIPIDPPRAVPDACTYDGTQLPLPVPPLDEIFTCVPDPLHGVECEPRVGLRIPIKLGPRTRLWDVAFDGPRSLTEVQLAEAADLPLGVPVNTTKIDEARRRILDRYKEQGFAYADVRYTLESSVDHSRARARFEITEGEQVIVRQIVIHGNDVTNDWTLRRRIALEVGAPYRTSDVRKTEERIATLGVFSNVSVGLEDPYVPQKNKVVIVDVVERPSQYVELRPGFSTGEGVRGAFEYGHRNVAGDAIALTLRAQASYLPDEFILDPQVRANYDSALGRGFSDKRLASRVTASVAVPEIGLGPLVRLQVDGVYVRDLERDFALTKFAAIPGVNYRPVRELQFSLSQSFERNDVLILSGENVNEYLADLQSQNADLARLLRAPNGASYAFAQKFVVAWDRRDNSFNAHRGTFFSSGVEHIDWYALDPPASEGHTVKFTETFAGYIPLGKRLTLAAELRVGTNVQLVSGSTTYTDRYFFLGGTDSMRGWLQDSFMPQELADQIAHDAKLPTPASTLTFQQRCQQKFDFTCVPVRGGNLVINPRAELRIPVRPPVGTVVFLDAGNLWNDPSYLLEHGFSLRYGAGTGIRIDTPIGPVAFDFGINLSRLASSADDPRRSYEQPFNVHFAIGLF